MVTGPMLVGSRVNTTSRDFSRAYSFWISRLESCERNALRKHRLLKGLARGIGIGLQRKFQIVRSLRRSDGEPLVLAHWNLVLLSEAENVRVKFQRFVLIVHHDAG
jgi:hypothetical protein